MSMIEGPKSNEITAVEQIDTTVQECLSKLAIWDFLEITKEITFWKFTSKSEKLQKIINY